MWYRGEGLPMEPGRTGMPTRLPTMSTDSVWPKPSCSVRPVCSWNLTAISGLSASPAVTAYWTEENMPFGIFRLTR